MTSDTRTNRRWLSGEDTEVTLISLGVGVLIAVAIVDGVVDFVPQSVITAAIFTALLLLVRLSTKLFAIERNTAELITRAQDETTVLRFDNFDGLYEALYYRLRSARRGLRLTHVRDDPPAAFGHDDFYEAVRQWPAAHPACKVERIIALPTAEMRTWAEQLREDEKQYPNFHVCVTSRSAGLPVINMVIIDDHDVFLFVSGRTAQDTAGLWLTGEGVARDFAVFFDQLFSKSTPLADALKEPIEQPGAT